MAQHREVGATLSDEDAEEARSRGVKKPRPGHPGSEHPAPRKDTSFFSAGACQEVRCLDPEPQNPARNSSPEACAAGHLPGRRRDPESEMTAGQEEAPREASWPATLREGLCLTGEHRPQIPGRPQPPRGRPQHPDRPGDPGHAPLPLPALRESEWLQPEPLRVCPSTVPAGTTPRPEPCGRRERTDLHVVIPKSRA